jgi:integrase/recombinase XerD
LVYRNIVRHYGLETGVNAEVNGLCIHSLRTTAATQCAFASVGYCESQEWLGHANVSTTPLYDRRKTRAEDSSPFRGALIDDFILIVYQKQIGSSDVVRKV